MVRILDHPESNRVEVIADSYTASIELGQERLSVSLGEMVFSFLLAGSVCFRHAGRTEVMTETGVMDEALYDIRDTTICLAMSGNGPAMVSQRITLRFDEDYFTYEPVLEAHEGIEIVEALYGAFRRQDGELEKSAASFEEFFIWDPDRYQAIIPHNQTVEIKLASIRTVEEGFFRGDAGKYLVPPYLTALRSGGQWLGLGTMEIPASTFGLHAVVSRQDYYLGYRYPSGLRADRNGGISLPRLGFFPAAGRDSTLERYLGALSAEGRTIKPNTWTSWWGNPIYCSYADQVYHHTLASGIMKDEPGATVYCNKGFLEDRLAIMERAGIPYGTVILDYGWLDLLGDYHPHPERFADLKSYIADLHRRGKHVLLWFAPFFCEAGSMLTREHPDWLLKNRDGSLHAHTWMKKQIHTPDFSHPEVRCYFRTMVERLLSPGGLDADGFKIDGYSFLPAIELGLFDPAWGTGEVFQHLASKIVYEAAKAAKPEALIENSFANPLFNDVQDLCRLNDASNYDRDLYDDRAWVAWTAGAAIPDTDDWSAFDKFFVQSTLRKAIYGIPALYAVKHRGHGRMGGASGGYPISIPQEDYDRVGAILRVYCHAPLDPSQERYIDPDGKVFWRKYTKGRLSGFYAALGLNGNTAIAVYTPQDIWLAAIVGTRAAVPLPPGLQCKAVREMRKDGAILRPDYSLLEEEVVLRMEPSVGDIDHYEIELW